MHLPSDEMKGRIIGREGRNIRAFEQVTGVNLIIDDTPEAVLLSCFDPVRREIGRLTLEKLVLDGRIHPHRIEEVYERSKRRGRASSCLRAAEDALVEVGITDLHPELVPTARPAALPHVVRAERAQAPGRVRAHRRASWPPSCGWTSRWSSAARSCTTSARRSPTRSRAVHAIIGAELARKYGETDDVVHAIEAHHNEVEPQTVEAVLTQAADAAQRRPAGARRESLEAYVKRLERLEEIAGTKTGVEKVFAMQAGREIRVMVLPDAVDDIEAAGDRARHRQAGRGGADLPGQIRVTVVRESRATETAR